MFNPCAIKEHVAVSKIKVDPKHFFRYDKRYSICKQVGPLLNPLNNTLTDNKYEMCLLVNQFNSVFTKPEQTSVIKDPVTFFSFRIQTVRVTNF